MSQVEAGVFGYISGLIVGSLIFVFVIAWFYYNQTDSGSPPEWYLEPYNDMRVLYETQQTTFTLLFVLGFLSGLSGSGGIVSVQYNRHRNN